MRWTNGWSETHEPSRAKRGRGSAQGHSDQPDRVQAVKALENAGFGKTDWLKAELKAAQGLLAERNAEVEKLRATIRQMMKDLMR